MSYTAADIRVLEPQEVVERFTWARIGELCDRYNRPAEWIERGFEACSRAGVDPEAYFVPRYLQKLDLPRNLEVEVAFVELQRERRD